MTPVFAVGDAATATRLLAGKAILVSDAYLGTNWIPWARLAELLAVAAERWIDCGAFTRWQQALKGKPSTPLTVETWAARINATHGLFDHFVALDVIGDADASLRNWATLLELVAPEHHEKIVPVWHEGDPLEHLDAYDPDARLVAIGRTAGRKPGTEGKRLTFRFYDAAFNAYPDGRFHLLGNSNPETIQPYPARSFDATTWQRDSAYAQSHGWPWSAVTKETRMRAYIEAFEQIRHVPREQPKRTAWTWAQEAP